MGGAIVGEGMDAAGDKDVSKVSVTSIGGQGDVGGGKKLSVRGGTKDTKIVV